MRTLIFAAAALVLSFFAFSQSCEAAESGDTYNFYFQKAPGPQTVIQGGTQSEKSLTIKESDKGVEVQQTPAAPAHATVKTEIKTEEKKDDLLKWAFRLGEGIRNVSYSFSNFDESYTGSFAYKATSIGGTYSVNKYFAWDAEILFLHDTERRNLSDGWNRKVRSERNTAGYLGMQITPFRLSLFSYDLMDFSFIVGITESSDIDSANRLATYTGLRYAINITKNFALEARARYTAELHPEYSATVTWRF